MVSYSQNDIRTQILEHAKTFGAITATSYFIVLNRALGAHEQRSARQEGKTCYLSAF